MTQFPYLSESETANLIGVATGKGNAWRHLRQHAPHIKIVKVAGQNAVLRSDVEAWLENGRSSIVPLERINRRRKLAAAIRKAKQDG